MATLLRIVAISVWITLCITDENLPTWNKIISVLCAVVIMYSCLYLKLIVVEKENTIKSLTQCNFYPDK